MRATQSNSAEIDRMNEYKGGPLPSPIIPLSGAAIGLVLPWLFHSTLLKGPASLPKSGVDGLLTWIQVAPILSGLFFAEFGFGAAARSKSNRASFSPAAAAASDAMPLELVEANRIHQNQIENFVIFLPSVLAASVVDSSWAVSCTLSWTMSRLLYRYGYCYKANPFWRICGVSASMIQSIICVTIGLSGKSPPGFSG